MALIEPIYATLPEKDRYRANYEQLIANDVVILACMLLQVDQWETSERHFHRSLLEWGIVVPERSRYHRRCRQLTPIMDLIHVTLLQRWVFSRPINFAIIDSAPVVVASGRRSQHAKSFVGLADKGRNIAKDNFYYGFKFHFVIADVGYCLNWGLSAASLDDREMLEPLVTRLPIETLLADGGYVSQDRHDWLINIYGIELWTPTRRNMRKIVAEFPGASGKNKNHRRRIETAFKNLITVAGLEHPGLFTLTGMRCRFQSMVVWYNINVHENLKAGISGLRITR